MKQIVLACALLGSIAVAYAQPEIPPEPKVHAEKLQKVLQLNDDQTAKIKKTLETSAQQRKALMEKYKPQLEAFHADMKNLHDQTHAQIVAVLTPKQAQALEAMHSEREHEMRSMHKGMEEHKGMESKEHSEAH